MNSAFTLMEIYQNYAMEKGYTVQAVFNEAGDTMENLLKDAIYHISKDKNLINTLNSIASPCYTRVESFEY